jgi:hypothetical protein
MTEAPDDEPTADAADPPKSLAAAYVELNGKLKGGGLSAEQLKSIGKGFRGMQPLIDSGRTDFLAEPLLKMQRTIIPEQSVIDNMIERFQPDTRPDEIAANTERAAELMSEQNEAIAQLVEITLSNLALSKTQQEHSERTERFARRMSWASVIIAGASLAAAVAAIAVSIASMS